MIVIKPIIGNDGKVEPRWAMVDIVLRREIWSNWELGQTWHVGGYDKIALVAPEHFGMNAMYRDERDNVTFEFTEHQWTVFALRWL